MTTWLSWVARVRAVLTPDLLRPAYRGGKGTAGHCYVATEALFYLLGTDGRAFTSCFLRHEGQPHWYLRHDASGLILDPTADQFRTPPPYDQGVGKGFLTLAPSNRALVVIRRVMKRNHKDR